VGGGRGWSSVIITIPAALFSTAKSIHNSKKVTEINIVSDLSKITSRKEDNYR
jgi:hypothetical protein